MRKLSGRQVFRMNTVYTAILKCEQKGRLPIISPYMISKNQYDRIQEIVHENSPKKGWGDIR